MTSLVVVDVVVVGEEELRTSKNHHYKEVPEVVGVGVRPGNASPSGSDNTKVGMGYDCKVEGRQAHSLLKKIHNPGFLRRRQQEAAVPASAVMTVAAVAVAGIELVDKG